MFIEVGMGEGQESDPASEPGKHAKHPSRTIPPPNMNARGPVTLAETDTPMAKSIEQRPSALFSIFANRSRSRRGLEPDEARLARCLDRKHRGFCEQ